MLRRPRTGSRIALSLCLVASGFACSDAAGPEEREDLQIRALTSGPATQSGGAQNAVVIDRILLVVGRVKLEKTGATPADFVDEGSIVIELDPGAEPILALSADVPEGEYKELEIAIDKLEEGHPDEQTLIDAVPALSDASVLIEGTVVSAGDARRFTFASDLDIDLELTFDPPLAIADAATSTTLISLILDVTNWFLGSSGELLDPGDPADRSPIEANVQASIELFEGAVPAGD